MTYCSYEVFSGESRLAMIPRGYRRDGTKPAVLMTHGHSTDTSGPHNVVPFAGYGWSVAQVFLDAGLPVCLPDVGGGRSWNSTVAVRHLDSARQWMITAHRAKTGPAHMWGFSMGGMLCSSYAAEHPSSVKTLILICPAVDMPYIHDSNYNGYGKGELRAAHGGTLATYEAALPTKDPMAQAAAGYLDAIPTLIYHAAPTDTVVPLDSINQFASDVGAEIHQAQPQWHAPDITDPVRLQSFIAEHR